MVPPPILPNAVLPPASIVKQGEVIQIWIDQVPPDYYVIYY